jgi:hypothetical protein
MFSRIGNVIGMSSASALSTPADPSAPADPAARASRVAVVTCVEAGPMEAQTLRMIESLRKWGGAMAQVPVVAVTPRFGPRLQRATLKRYEALNVIYTRQRSGSSYAWYNFLNKPASFLAAERLVNVDTMIWLDADVLIVSEPSDLVLRAGEDFTACPTEKNIATTGPDDPYHPFWEAMCAAGGIKVDDLPWVTDCRENRQIRAYFNCGIIGYRPASGFAQAYMDACHHMLEAKVLLPNDGLFYHEQVAVSVALVRLGLRWRRLENSHNYDFGSKTLHLIDPEQFRRAKVLHYHRSLQKQNFGQFLELLDQDFPQVRQWLEPSGPLGPNPQIFHRALSGVLRRVRNRQADRYRAVCRTIKIA